VNREAVWLSGYDKQSPLYTFTTILNVFRTQAIKTSNNYITYNSRVIYNDSSTISMRKGFDGSQVVTVLANDGILGASRTITLQNANKTGFLAGDVVTDVISCTNSTVDEKGDLTVTIKGGMPSVFYLASHLVGTTICFNGTTVNPNIVSMDPPHKNGAWSNSQGAARAIFWTLIASAALGIARWL
jgi:alpha-amylase